MLIFLVFRAEYRSTRATGERPPARIRESRPRGLRAGERPRRHESARRGLAERRDGRHDDRRPPGQGRRGVRGVQGTAGSAGEAASRAQRRARVAWNEPGRIEGASFPRLPRLRERRRHERARGPARAPTESLFARAASSPRARGFFAVLVGVHPSPHRELTRSCPPPLPLILESPTQIIARASVYLTDSYKKCNPGFEYASHLNPRRMLTKPRQTRRERRPRQREPGAHHQRQRRTPEPTAEEAASSRLGTLWAAERSGRWCVAGRRAPADRRL